MVKSSKKGFTLVELLVTIILLGVIGGIVVYNMMNVSTNSKETEYERFISKVKSSAENYASLNPDVFRDLYVNKAYLYIKMEDLINDGQIDENLMNPYTEEKIKPNELIKANLSTTNGALTFEYPVEGKEEENFLVALSDYVVYQEPYDCMQGAGTYQLALSDENGELILLNDPSVIEKYNFSCEYPSEFEKYDDSSPASYQKGMYAKDPGTYDITYNWVTESGIRKSTKRTLRVLAEVEPTFAIKEFEDGESTVYPYNFKDYYTPSYTEEKGWKYLTYTPFVEGADPESTTYSVKKVALAQYEQEEMIAPGAKEEIVTTDSSDFSTAYPVDDGIKRYTINTTVRGHYNKDYSYDAKSDIVMKSKLVIPIEYISVSEDNWSTDSNVTIEKGVHSPVGIAYYEYRLNDAAPEDTVDVEDGFTFDHNHDKNASIHVPLRNNNNLNVDVEKHYSVYNDSACADKKIEYPKFYVRAINDDGYVGDWQHADINLTSDLKKLLQENTNCHEISNTSCYFTDKNVYLDYAGHRFVVLENFGDGTYKATSAVPGKSVSPINMKPGSIEIASCDMMVYANFHYRSPFVDSIFTGAIMNLPKFEDHLNEYEWPYTYVTITSYNGGSKFGTTHKYTSRTDSTTKKAYYGNANIADVNKYGKAMSVGSRYWTVDMYSRSASITAYGEDGSHGTRTSYYNGYIYTVDGSGTVEYNYVGDTENVKPMVIFKNINVCGTTVNDGSITYKVALEDNTRTIG